MARTKPTCCVILILVMCILTLPAYSDYYFRVDTHLQSNGSINREILQPSLTLPVSTIQKGLWEYFKIVERPFYGCNPPSNTSPLPVIAKSLVPYEGGRQSYTLAWGHYTSPDIIPDHFELYPYAIFPDYPSAPDLKASKLKREYTQNNLIFVSEHKWRETLTSSMEHQKFTSSLDELIELLGKVNEQLWGAAIRPEYDATNYIDWYKSKLLSTYKKQWKVLVDGFQAINSAGIEINTAPYIQQLSDNLMELELPLKKAYYGMEEPDLHDVPIFFYHYPLYPSLLFLCLPDVEDIFDNYLEEQEAPMLLKRRDGEPMNQLSLISVLRDDSGEIVKSVIKEVFGGTDALMQKLNKLYGSLLADLATDSFDCFFFCDQYLYRFSLTMPGQIVKTNGTLISTNKVTWGFNNLEVFPNGKHMYAYSVELNKEQQQKLLGDILINSHEKAIEFVNLVGERPYILEDLERAEDNGVMPADLLEMIGLRYKFNNSPLAWSWYCRAIAAGGSDAAEVLGDEYSKTGNNWYQELTGIQPDLRAAFVWFSIATQREKTNGYLQQKLQEITRKLTPDSLSEAKNMLNDWTPDRCPWPGIQ